MSIHENVKRRADEIYSNFISLVNGFDDADKGDTGTETVTDESAEQLLRSKELEQFVRRGENYNDPVQRVLSRYIGYVKHGVNVTIGTRGRVSWNIETNPLLNKATISYCTDRGEWVDDLYPESVPSWLLLHLLRKIRINHPWLNPRDKAIIDAVERLDDEKEAERLRNERDNVRLNVVSCSSLFNRGGD